MSLPTPIILYSLSSATMLNLLPSGYTPLAYIESSGTLYIDTGWIPNANNKIETIFEPLDTNSSYYPITCIRTSDNKLISELFVKNKGEIAYAINGSENTKTGNYSGIQYAILTTDKLILNGIVIQSGNKPTIETSYSCIVMGYNNKGSIDSRHISCKLYSFKGYNSSLAVDLRPAKRDSDGVIGMYDLVSKTFKTNSGTGAFIAGPQLAVGKGEGKSLPNEYLQVEYIENTTTQYIDTGFTATGGMKVQFCFSRANTSGMVCIIGSHNYLNSTNEYNRNEFGVNGTDFYANVNGSYSNGSSGFAANNWYTIEFVSSKTLGLGYKVNNVSHSITTPSLDLTPNNTVKIFRSEYQYTIADRCKIQYCKLYNSSGTLVRDMYACYRKSDMKPGMYDVVNGVFYTNAGSGEFVLGPNIINYYSIEPNAQGGSFNYFKNLRVGGRTTLINDGQGFTATFTSNDTYNFMDMYPLLNGYDFTFSCDVSGLPSDSYWYFNLWNDEATHPWKLQNGHNSFTTLITTDRIKNYNTNSYTLLYCMLWDDGSRSTPDNSSVMRVENIKIYKGIYDTPAYAYFRNLNTVYDSRFGYVADFSTSSVEMPGLYTLLKGGTDFTFSIWFKRSSGGGWNTIWGCSGFELEGSRSGGATNQIVAYSWGQSSSGGIEYTLNQWHHLAMTRNTNESKFYLDGELKYTGSAGSIPDTPLFLGCWKLHGSLSFYGQMTNMMLFNTVLTAALVKELYGQ